MSLGLPIKQEEIDEAISKAKKKGYYAVLVVTDTFDYTTYTVDIKKEKNYEKMFSKYNDFDEMSTVREIHLLSEKKNG